MYKKTLWMIFEKSSTRTRVSFETWIFQLGWQWLFLSINDIQLWRWELLKDTSRVLSTMVDMMVLRTYWHEKLEEFAKYSSIPIINWLSDKFHPLQIIADYMTIIENNKQDNLIVAYVWDWNNIANSWVELASIIWFELRIATPKWYGIEKQVLEKVSNLAKISWSKIIISNNPQEVVKWATVVTTDTWISMWQENEKEKKIHDFEWFIVDEKLMKLSHKDSIFLHCLPAYRGYEVSENVLEWSHSVIWQEAENRLHSQKWIMVWLDKYNKN